MAILIAILLSMIVLSVDFVEDILEASVADAPIIKWLPFS